MWALQCLQAIGLFCCPDDLNTRNQNGVESVHSSAAEDTSHAFHLQEGNLYNPKVLWPQLSRKVRHQHRGMREHPGLRCAIEHQAVDENTSSSLS